jgi:hypothetical protein
VAGQQPISRLLLAVPFSGKGLPTPSSEFAHPDIVVALSYLAYSYEGLRLSDCKTVIDHLQVTPRSSLFSLLSNNSSFVGSVCCPC